MFAHIRKHQQWLFIVIIAVVIVSFVVFFTPTVGSGNSGGRSGADAVVGTYKGQPITQTDYYEAYKEISLQVFLSMGQWPEQLGTQFGFDPTQEAVNRLMLVRKLEEMNIQVGPESVAKWKVNSFSDPATGAFRNELYDNVLAAIKARGISEDDLHRYAANTIGIGQLTSLVSLSGDMVTPGEAERLYKSRNLAAATSAVMFSRTNHMSAGQDLVGLEDYFTNNMALYRVEEKRKIRYVKFAATNYLAEAEAKLNQSTNLQSMIDAIYLDRGTNSFTRNGEVLSAEEAKEQIREEELEKAGLEVAIEETKNFMKGFANFEAYSSAVLEQLAVEGGQESKVTTEFSRNQLAPGLGVSFTFTQRAFELTEEEPIATPFEAPDAIYLFALEEIIPDHPPTLDEVRARVVGEFRRDQQLQAARDEATQFHESLKAAMAEGKTFEEACSELGQTIVEIPDFSLASRTLDGFTDRRITVSWLQDLAFSLEPGETSEVSNTTEGAGILYLKDFVEADETKMSEELADFTEQLRQTRRSEAISEWLQQEMASVQRATANSSEDTSSAN